MHYLYLFFFPHVVCLGDGSILAYKIYLILFFSLPCDSELYRCTMIHVAVSCCWACRIFSIFCFINNAMLNSPACYLVVCVTLQDKLIKGRYIWYFDRNCKCSSHYVYENAHFHESSIKLLFSGLISEKFSHVLFCVQLQEKLDIVSGVYKVVCFFFHHLLVHVL